MLTNPLSWGVRLSLFSRHNQKRSLIIDRPTMPFPFRLRRGLAFLSVIALCALPSRAQTNSVPQKASISGQVVREGTGAPLSRASVVLKPDVASGGRGQPLNAATDAAGHFLITGIEAGRYRLEVSRDGFVSQEYSVQAGGPGAILSLTAGQEMKDLLFRLKSGGVISGRVTDDNGDPLPYVEVQALRKSNSHGAMRISRDEPPAVTDDLGEYRAFDLVPGRYYVIATYSPENILEGEAAKYVPSFYPEGNDMAHASPVDVTAGQEVSGIDFVISPSPVVQVRGNVLNPATGRPGKGSAIAFEKIEAPGGDIAATPLTAVAAVDGTFEITNVTAGTYIATATLDEQSRQYFARQNVDVGPGGLVNLTLILSSGINLPGRAIYQGNGGTRASETSVLFRAVNDSSAIARTAPLNSDSSFTAKNVPPGIYQIDVRPICLTCYLKSVKLAGVDIMQEGLELTNGAPGGSLEVVVSAQGGFVSGTVTDGDDHPVAGGRVVLVPDPSRRKQGRLYKEATTDQYGAFKLQGIAPGNYKVFAWEGMQDAAYQDPEFIRSIETMGTEVHVDENAGSAVEVNAIPASSGQ